MAALSRKQYIDILHPDIPDLGNIIAEYTGGQCDSITEGATKCWTQSKNCGDYCFRNLDVWLYPIFRDLILSAKEDMEFVLQNLYTHELEFEVLDFDSKKLSLNFSNNELLSNIDIVLDQRGTGNFIS